MVASSTCKVAVLIVVVVPFTVKSPLTPRLPVTSTPVAVACAFTLLPCLMELASIPVSAEPSPLNDVAVTTPEKTAFC